jgi:hypothetical protein
LALLLSAHPDLTAADQQNALISSAVDLGLAGADNVYGYGRLNVLAAFNSLGSLPTSTPLPTNTATPLPTDTPAATLTSTPLPTFTSVPSNTPTALPTFTSAPSSTPTVAPTFTPLPTNTATQVPTFTATSTVVVSATMHSGDLDRSSTRSGTKWNAVVTIRVHNDVEQVVANATVTGQWSNGATGTASCVTNSSGVCTITKTGINNNTTSATFTVTNVTKSSLTYNAASNHDPDGESNGTTIVVLKP